MRWVRSIAMEAGSGLTRPRGEYGSRSTPGVTVAEPTDSLLLWTLRSRAQCQPAPSGAGRPTPEPSLDTVSKEVRAVPPPPPPSRALETLCRLLTDPENMLKIARRRSMRVFESPLTRSPLALFPQIRPRGLWLPPVLRTLKPLDFLLLLLPRLRRRSAA